MEEHQRIAAIVARTRALLTSRWDLAPRPLPDHILHWVRAPPGGVLQDVTVDVDGSCLEGPHADVEQVGLIYNGREFSTLVVKLL